MSRQCSVYPTFMTKLGMPEKRGCLSDSSNLHTPSPPLRVELELNYSLFCWTISSQGSKEVTRKLFQACVPLVVAALQDC